jgi:hypothetical protein
MNVDLPSDLPTDLSAEVSSFGQSSVLRSFSGVIIVKKFLLAYRSHLPDLLHSPLTLNSVLTDHGSLMPVKQVCLVSLLGLNWS